MPAVTEPLHRTPVAPAPRPRTRAVTAEQRRRSRRTRQRPALPAIDRTQAATAAQTRAVTAEERRRSRRTHQQHCSPQAARTQAAKPRPVPPRTRQTLQVPQRRLLLYHRRSLQHPRCSPAQRRAVRRWRRERPRSMPRRIERRRQPALRKTPPVPPATDRKRTELACSMRVR